MKKIHVVILSSLIFIFLNAAWLMASGTRDTDTDDSIDYPFKNKSLTDVLSKQKDVSFIFGALEKTGLADQMAELEGYTLFIPTNEVVARLHESVRKAMVSDPAVLLEVLTDQMVKGVLSAEALKEMNSVTSMGGVNMLIGRRGKKITLADSDLIKTDLFGRGFVVHVVTGIIVSGVTLKL